MLLTGAGIVLGIIVSFYSFGAYETWRAKKLLEKDEDK